MRKILIAGLCMGTLLAGGCAPAARAGGNPSSPSATMAAGPEASPRTPSAPQDQEDELMTVKEEHPALTVMWGILGLLGLGIVFFALLAG